MYLKIVHEVDMRKALCNNYFIRFMSSFHALDSCRQNISVSAKCKSSWLEVLKKYLHKKALSHLKGPQVKDPEGEEGIAKEAEAECSSKTSPPLSESVASPNSTLSPFQESMLKFATALESGADGYQSLAVEEKLQLLNLLCNDVLSTAYVSDSELLSIFHQ